MASSQIQQILIVYLYGDFSRYYDFILRALQHLTQRNNMKMAISEADGDTGLGEGISYCRTAFEISQRKADLYECLDLH
jgi:hypothetical protein